MIHHFIVKGTPKGKGRPRFAQGHAYTPQSTREYEKQILCAWKAENAEPFSENAYISLSVDAYFPIPKSARKDDRFRMANGYMLPSKKPDADNILKAVADALNGYAFQDDKQIVGMHVRKFYTPIEAHEGWIDVFLSDE